MAKKFRLTPQKAFVPKEFDDQCVVFELLKYCKLDGADMAFSTLNGIRLPIGLAVKAKKAGNKQGVPDILIDVARGQFHGLRIELKREKGGVVSQVQSDWHDRLRQEGYKVVIARGANEAIAAIKTYLDGPLMSEFSHRIKHPLVWAAHQRKPMPDTTNKVDSPGQPHGQALDALPSILPVRQRSTAMTDDELRALTEQMQAEIAQSDPRFVSDSVRTLADGVLRLLDEKAALSLDNFTLSRTIIKETTERAALTKELARFKEHLADIDTGDDRHRLLERIAALRAAIYDPRDITACDALAKDDAKAEE